MTKEIVKPSNKFIRSRKNKIIRMNILCYKNALRLHQDSIYLYKKQRYPSANALSIIALEEMGKHMALSHGLFYDYFDKGQDEDFISMVMKQTYDHRIKQAIFMNFDWLDVLYADEVRLKKQNIDSSILFEKFYPHFHEPNYNNPEFEKYFPNLGKFYKRLHSLDTNKQDSFYVGYPKKKGGNADIEKKLRSPFRITRKKAEEQITILNDYILLEALKVLKGASEFGDGEEELDEMITPKFIKQIRTNWKIVGKRKAKWIAELSKLPDNKWSLEE